MEKKIEYFNKKFTEDLDSRFIGEILINSMIKMAQEMVWILKFCTILKKLNPNNFSGRCRKLKTFYRGIKKQRYSSSFNSQYIKFHR